MSLEQSGVWLAGVWAFTVWGDGVWSEGDPPATTASTGEGVRNRRLKGFMARR